MTEPSIPAVLRERASLQPNDTAFTFIDYDSDPGGAAESLTWAQVYRRALNIAHELSLHSAPGDRAVILAPQGLDYVAAFLGAMQAGLIAVPLSVPYAGAHDERVRSVLRDTTPAILLTTSAAVDAVTEYVQPSQCQQAPAIVEVDGLDLDLRRSGSKGEDCPTAFLQYTSGSTRQPAGVVVTHRNVLANYEQKVSNYFPHRGSVVPPTTTVVSWLPFYHDMGLILGVCTPILGGLPAVLTSPVSFMQRPARWMQLVASNFHAWTGAPNFAFEVAANRTSDADMAGLDLGDVLGIISGSERIQPATLSRFSKKFAPFGLSESAVLPSYGLAEATVFVATRTPDHPPEVVRFDSEKLSAGHAALAGRRGGTALISYGTPRSPVVRIVDPETRTEKPADTIGEIWVRGENVAMGYWQRAEETERTFGAMIENPSPGTPEGPWLRTGDLGLMFEGELFIVGRIKDLLVVYGHNHYPDDIEATIQEITGGRVAAIAVPTGSTEKLVAILEVKKRGDTEPDAMARLRSIKNEVTQAVSETHGLSAADLVLVAPGSLPTTTSGKVRRAACVQQYRGGEFTRLDT